MIYGTKCEKDKIFGNHNYQPRMTSSGLSFGLRGRFEATAILMTSKFKNFAVFRGNKIRQKVITTSIKLITFPWVWPKKPLEVAAVN